MTDSVFSRGSLGRRLLWRVVALTAGVALVLATAATFAVRQAFILQYDGELDNYLQSDVFHAELNDPVITSQLGKRDGAISVVKRGNGRTTATRVTNDAVVALDDEIVKKLSGLSATDTGQLVLLPGLGVYRAMVMRQPVGTATGDREVALVAAAVPMEPLRRLTLQLLAIELLLMVGVVTVGAGILRQLVMGQIEPLTAVAETADDVAALELAEGTVTMPAALPEQTTDSLEIARVKRAFNRMVNHVGSSLRQREASERRVRNFVADASHELRNPLAGIKGYAELTRHHRDTIPDDVAFSLERIEAESNRMGRLVEDMLLLARLDSHQGLTLGEMDLTEALLGQVSDARVAGPEHVWRLSLPPEAVMVRADEHRLTQVLVNLLTNARVHTPAGTRVNVGLVLEGDDAVITVADNGPGVPPDRLPHLFDRFARGDTTRARGDAEKPSTGLGLAIVLGVAQAHGGTASVTSDGDGTTFTVRVPLAGPLEEEPSSGA